jgi:hypothetical protein
VSTPGNEIQGYVTTQPPKSPRAANFADMQFQAGIASNAPSRDLKGRFVASDRVRWHKGFPEKVGGWQQVGLTPPGGTQLVVDGIAIPSIQYIGTCRAACDWASLDGQYWLAFATECKLYLVNNDFLYDITPIRLTSNSMNVFSTTLGSALVTITDPNNFANQGDHISIIGPISVGGLTLNGDYDIVAVLDPNDYQILASSNATSTVTNGGGSVTIEYDVSCGLAVNGELTGYGTALYGEGEYGTPRAAGTGVPAKMRTWSLSNWGQDLVASYNNGELYWWQWMSGPTTPAALVANAPTDIQRILVNADAEFLIAVGAADVSGNADPMNVRWCSEGDLNDWVPVVLPVPNTAGGQRLNYGSRMVAAIQSRQQNLLWSDTQLYQMQFLGEPNFFGFNELGKCYLVGPNAVIDVNGVVYMMCFEQFMIYDGTLRTLDCEMWETVFGSVGLGFDRTQSEMVFCSSFMLKNEVQWLYPANDGKDTMLTITYNYELNVWYGGTMPRTCYHDVTPALVGWIQYPYAFNAGYLYNQEFGYDQGEGLVTYPMYYFLQSWDIGVQSDRPAIINSVIPEWQRLRNGIQFSYLCKEYPQDASYLQVGPFILTPDASKYDARASGAQVALLLEAAQVLNSTATAPTILLHMDGSQGATSFPDSSANAVAVTAFDVIVEVNGDPGFGIGGDCALLTNDGGSLSWPNGGPGGLFDFGNGDFTVTFRCLLQPWEGIYQLFGFGGSGGFSSQSFYGIMSADGNLNTQYCPLGGSVSGGPTSVNVTDGVWHHLAFCRSGVNFLFFLDGVAQSPTAFLAGQALNNTVGTASLGQGLFTHCQEGTMFDEFMVIKGLALYTADFTPPVVPYNALGIVLGQDFRMGVWQAQATPHGKRLGMPSMGSPINTNNP